MTMPMTVWEPVFFLRDFLWESTVLISISSSAAICLLDFSWQMRMAISISLLVSFSTSLFRGIRKSFDKKDNSFLGEIIVFAWWYFWLTPCGDSKNKTVAF